jgi:hypothetical protein
MEVLPERKALRFAQLQDVLVHVMQGDIFPAQTVVAALQCDEVVPTRGGDKDFVAQLAVTFVAAVEAIFVGFANLNSLIHPLPPGAISNTAILT